MAFRTPPMLGRAQERDNLKAGECSSSSQMKLAVEEAAVTVVQEFAWGSLPHKAFTQALNIQKRIQLADQHPPAGTQCFPCESQNRAGFIGSEPIKNIGKVNELVRLSTTLK